MDASQEFGFERFYPEIDLRSARSVVLLAQHSTVGLTGKTFPIVPSVGGCWCWSTSMMRRTDSEVKASKNQESMITVERRDPMWNRIIPIVLLSPRPPCCGRSLRRFTTVIIGVLGGTVQSFPRSRPSLPIGEEDLNNFQVFPMAERSL